MGNKLVCIVRTLSSGEVTREFLSPLEAVAEAMTGKQNGRTVISCHIEGDVTGWDMSHVPTVPGLALPDYGLRGD
jgi:hypothetical protein